MEHFTAEEIATLLGHGKIKNLTGYVLASEAKERERVLVEKYNELIFAVGYKYPNESRHETALRYILNAEKTDLQAGQDCAVLAAKEG